MIKDSVHQTNFNRTVIIGFVVIVLFFIFLDYEIEKIKEATTDLQKSLIKVQLSLEYLQKDLETNETKDSAMVSILGSIVRVNGITKKQLEDDLLPTSSTLSLDPEPLIGGR